METQNIEMTLRFLEVGAERPLPRGPGLVERLNPDAQELTPPNILQSSHQTPPVIAAHHNTDIDCELSGRMRFEAQEEALADAYHGRGGGWLHWSVQPSKDVAQRLRARHFTHKLAPSSVAWAVLILAITVVLIAMLMIGIAISV